MGRTVTFHRKQRGAVRLDQRELLFEIEIRLAKEVDPESGMTLNLVEVDEIFAGLWRHLKGHDFESSREILVKSRLFLEAQMASREARLREIEAVDLWAGTAGHWASDDPDRIFSVRRFPLRVQFGAGRFRSGEARVRSAWSEGVANGPAIELVAKDDAEMCDLLAALDDGAAEVFFQDALTLESWRITK